MKVVHVYWSLTYGGIETMLVNIANEQAKVGADVHVCIINEFYAKRLLDTFHHDVHVHLIGRKLKSRNVGFVLTLNSILNNLNPDAIHLHSSVLYTLLWRKHLKRLASVTLHALPSGAVRRFPVSRFFPLLELFTNGNVQSIDKVPKVFAISEAVKKTLWENYHVKSIVVNNGIRSYDFKLRPNHGVKGRMRIVQVSRLEHTKKGQDLLIKAAAAFHGRVHIDLIGDGSSRVYLEQLIKDLHAEEYVTFLGTKPQDYVAEHLCDYDLFVQASRWEGFGLTVAEAMAANVPVLVSADQGPAEITQGNKYGWVFENGSDKDLALKIDYIFNNYPDALVKARSARNHVIKTYDVSVTARKYLNLYQ